MIDSNRVREIVLICISTETVEEKMVGSEFFNIKHSDQLRCDSVRHYKGITETISNQNKIKRSVLKYPVKLLSVSTLLLFNRVQNFGFDQY